MLAMAAEQSGYRATAQQLSCEATTAVLVANFARPEVPNYNCAYPLAFDDRFGDDALRAIADAYRTAGVRGHVLDLHGRLPADSVLETSYVLVPRDGGDDREDSATCIRMVSDPVQWCQYMVQCHGSGLTVEDYTKRMEISCSLFDFRLYIIEDDGTAIGAGAVRRLDDSVGLVQGFAIEKNRRDANIGRRLVATSRAVGLDLIGHTNRRLCSATLRSCAGARRLADVSFASLDRWTARGTNGSARRNAVMAAVETA